MSTVVDAVYAEGALRLAHPLSLPDGTEVEVIIIPRGASHDARSPAEILKEIAAIPVEKGVSEFSGRDHDAVLYGDKDAR